MESVEIPVFHRLSSSSFLNSHYFSVCIRFTKPDLDVVVCPWWRDYEVCRDCSQKASTSVIITHSLSLQSFLNIDLDLSLFLYALKFD